MIEERRQRFQERQHSISRDSMTPLHLQQRFMKLSSLPIRRTSYVLILTWIILSSIMPSFCTPVELLQNGDFRDGLKEWRIEGVAFLDSECVKILSEGSLSQIVRRSDLSFYLELSYSVRTELPSKAYFARSIITFYVIDSKRRGLNFTIIGKTHEESGISGWKNVKLSLFQLFQSSVAEPGNFHIAGLKVTFEMGFTTSVPPPAAAYFRNISLKRVNPTKIIVQESGQKVLSDRTELAVSVANVGDIDASNLMVTLILNADTTVISEKTSFTLATLVGGAGWQLSWMLVSKSSGMHPVTVRVVADQCEVELSLKIPITGIPEIVTTQTVIKMMMTTMEKDADRVIILFAETAFLVLVALLIIMVVVPTIQSRRGTEVVFRLRPVRSH